MPHPDVANPAESRIAKEFPKMKIKIKTCPNMLPNRIKTGKLNEVNASPTIYLF